jgi:AcrR family transcriptional regulator
MRSAFLAGVPGEMTVLKYALRRERGTREGRRGELVGAAINIIAENGLAGTTLAKVAAEAGLSPRIVNHHFDTKDAMLIATLRTFPRSSGSALKQT